MLIGFLGHVGGLARVAVAAPAGWSVCGVAGTMGVAAAGFFGSA